MNHIRWVGWRVIELDNGTFDRMQRRNFIKRMRAELKELGAELHCGGSTQSPWYSIEIPIGSPMWSKISTGTTVDEKLKVLKHSAGGKDALNKVCAWFLNKIGDTHHERGADGSVRGAGAESERVLDQ